MLILKTPHDFTFDEAVKRLSETFREKSSLFNIRFQCLNLMKNKTDDFLTSIVNREYEKLKLRAMKEDQFNLRHQSYLQAHLAGDRRVSDNNIGKNAMNVSGEFLWLTDELQYEVSFDGIQFKGTCYLTKRPNLELIFVDWIKKLGLLELPLNREKFAPVFQDGFVSCDKIKVTLRIQPNTKPVFRPKILVLYATLSVVDQEIEHPQRDGIFQPVNYSIWATTMVAVNKAASKVRIDYAFCTGLNAALDTHQYPLPVPEDLFAKQNGGTCFAMLNLFDAYL
ncbi:unnamed protein product [Dibothriocephalus latus]|uniref:Uncharacterized protein n=1 Tax=Dibothriocephalus latus TaxID=60516 RepID=A0A3P7LM07_DIBLA|nr:unnamed protein product [Dibothriocephalus latus]